MSNLQKAKDAVKSRRLSEQEDSSKKASFMAAYESELLRQAQASSAGALPVLCDMCKKKMKKHLTTTHPRRFWP